MNKSTNFKSTNLKSTNLKSTNLKSTNLKSTAKPVVAKDSSIDLPYIGQTPGFVIRYLKAREELAMLEALVKTLEIEVIDWAVITLYSGEVESKILPVPELKDKQLILVEKLGMYNKNNPQLKTLQDSIEQETAIAFRENEKEINALLAQKQQVEDAINALLTTPDKAHLMAKLAEVIEQLKASAPIKRELHLKKK